MNESIGLATDWLLRTLAVGTGVLFLGWLVAQVSRTPATRRRVAGAAVAAALLVPVLSALPSWVFVPAPFPEVNESAGVTAPKPAFEGVPPVPEVVPEVADGSEAELLPSPAVAVAVAPDPPAWVGSSSPVDWRVLPLAVYGFCSFVLLVQLIRGHLILGRLWRLSRPLPGRLAVAAESEEADVRVSDRLGSAVCFGFLRPRVLLPLSLARSASLAEVGWVLQHEFDHARRGDHRTAYLLGVCRALYFPVPWFWLLRRDLQLSQEFLADAAAGRATPTEYATFLVDLSARGTHRPRLAATGVGGTRSDLFRRVTMILNPHVAPGRSARVWSRFVGAVILGVAVLASGVGLTAEEPLNKPKPVVPGEEPPAKPLPPEEKLLDPLALQRKLVDLMRAGNPDPDEIRRLMEEMSRQMRDQMFQRRGFGGPFPQLGGRFNPFGPVEPAKPAIREQYEKRLAEFDADIAKNADNPEAQAALKKARTAYVEAMAAELKKADEQVKNNPPAAAMPGFPNLPNIQFGGNFGGFQPFPAFPGFADPFAADARPSRLGIQVAKPSDVVAEQLGLPAGQGVVVTDVERGSPAEKAGVRKSDIVVLLAGKAAPSDPAAFADQVAGLKEGEKFDVEVIRKGKKVTVKGVEIPQPKKPALVPGGRLEAERLVPGGRLETDPVNFTQMQVQVINGSASIQATADGIRYAITGTAGNGGVIPNSIVIDDGKKQTYQSLDKVPAKHQPVVRQLLGQGRAFRR